MSRKLVVAKKTGVGTWRCLWCAFTEEAAVVVRHVAEAHFMRIRQEHR